MRILITGGTSGIGRAVALLLGQRGIDVDVIGGSNRSKGTDLATSFENLPGTLRFFPADLSSIKGAHGALEEYLSQTKYLDAAFLNAGVFRKEARIDDKGRDTAFIVNYLHRFIFVRRITEVLRGSSAPRILINGSANMALGIDLNRQVFGRQYAGTKGLTHALAANGFLTFWLNRKYDTGVPVQSINPGYVNTKMVEGGGFFMRLMSHWFAIEPKKAAEKIVQVLLDQNDAGKDGVFFDGTKDVGFKKGITREPEKFDQIWKLSLELAEMEP